MSNKLFSSSLILILSFMMSARFLGELAAQDPTKRSVPSANKSGSNGKLRTVAVTETFEPAFRIEPLSHQFTGRNGQLVPFEFTLEASNRDAEIEVTPIGLRQELTGMILHDDKAAQADLVRLTTPSKMKLSSNTPTKIQGIVQIPRGEAKFHSVGILVKDIGEAAKMPPNFDQGKTKTQAGIRFVTQYVLRLDLRVENVRGENANMLTIERLDLVPFDGRPKIIAQISNPSDSTFEFEVRAKLRSSPSDRGGRSIRMAMPVRESMESEERFVGRILPKSRIRMAELLPEAIASGSYEGDVEIVFDEKVLTKKTLKLDVNAEDFPAQEVLIAQVGKDVQISPAQIELSQLRGGNRRLTVLVKNQGKDTKTIDLVALGMDGLEMNAVMIQPHNFVLPPSGSRKISVTLKSQSEINDAMLYGTLVIHAQSDRKDFNESRKLPLALALKKSTVSEVKMSSVQWDPTAKYSCFRNTVTNLGETHVPLDARLSIFDEKGNRILISAGFGKWLMPGQTAKLEFRSENALSPGKYQIKCELRHGDRPIVVEQAFEVTDLENAQSSKLISIESEKESDQPKTSEID